MDSQDSQELVGECKELTQLNQVYRETGAVPLRFPARMLQLLPFLMCLLYWPIRDLAAVPEM